MIWGGGQKREKKTQRLLAQEKNSTQQPGIKKSSTARCRGKKKLNTKKNNQYTFY